ncbi:MAG: glycosyltransferase [Bacilli bacterium]
MKILIVFNHPAPYKVALFNGLAKVHDVHVIFERLKAKNRNRHFYNEANYDFTLHSIKGINLGNENHLSWGVVRHLKKHKYDLIIMNGYSTLTEMLALRYLKRKQIPYAFYINGGIVKSDKKFIKRIKTYFISGAKYYFSPAKKANEYLIHYGAPSDKIFNYPYSTVYAKDVLTNKISDEIKEAFWKEKGVTGKNFTICITSFIKRKNNLSLIKSWVNINKDNALILVGEGPEEKLYRQFIEANNLTNVYLLPFANKELVFRYLSHSHNAVYISNYDIYGHVINEALAHGLNVLTNTNMVAAHKAIKNGENGFIMQPDEKLNDKLQLLFSADFFKAATKSAITIEQSIAIHLEILGGEL